MYFATSSTFVLREATDGRCINARDEVAILLHTLGNLYEVDDEGYQSTEEQMIDRVRQGYDSFDPAAFSRYQTPTSQCSESIMCCSMILNVPALSLILPEFHSPAQLLGLA